MGTTLTPASSQIVIQTAGIYKVSFGVDLEGNEVTTLPIDWAFAVRVNGVVQANLTLESSTPLTAAPPGSATSIHMSGFLSLNVGDVVDVAMMTETATHTAIVEHANLNLFLLH